MRNVLIYILVFSFLNYVGCYSSRAVDKEILLSNNNAEPIDELTIITSDDRKIIIDEITYQIVDDTLYTEGGELTIITNNDKKIIIDEITYQIVDDTLYAEGINKTNTEVYGKPINLKLATNDIQYVEIDALDVFRTVGCITASVGAVGMSVIMVFLFKDYKGCEGPKSLNDLN